MATSASGEWRICPEGEHYIRAHALHIPPSKNNPHGKIVTRKAHCAKCTSSRDTLSYDELQCIAQSRFAGLDGPPTAKALKFDNADEFDMHIRGWTQYWNSVFNLTEPLDPNLVKALWDDTVAEYKGILKGIIENKNPDPKGEMKIFRRFYQ